MEVRANEVATLLDDFIRRVDEEGQTKTSLFYDNCPGRNKDRMVITVAYFALQSCSNLTDVAISYLLRGLTCMPFDSMPVPLERVLVHQPFTHPVSGRVICMARRDPLPNEVREYTNSYSKDWIAVQRRCQPQSIGKDVSKVSLQHGELEIKVRAVHFEERPS